MIEFNKLLIGGLVISVAVAAFFGGYTLGIHSDSTSNDDLARLILNMQNPNTVALPDAAILPDAPVLISIDDDPIKGNPEADIRIIEFSDFQCPFCSKFYTQTLPLLEQNYINGGKVNLVFRDMPLDFHKNALPAHIAAECADNQGLFWQYHDILFQRQDMWESSVDVSVQLDIYAKELGLDDSLFQDCISSSEVSGEIQRDRAHGSIYGATGTPTFFIGNDDIGYVKLSGAKPYSAFAAIIDSQMFT